MSRDHLGQFMVSSSLGFARGILILEDCEGTMNWTVSGTGGDDVHAFATAMAFMGTYGLSMATRTTAAAQNDLLQVVKLVGYPETGLLVLRARLMFPDLTGAASVNLVCAAFNGVREWVGMLSIIPATGVVSYYNSVGGMTNVAGLAGLIQANGWATMELVVDMLRMEYIEAAWNGRRADLSGASLNDAAATTYRECRIGLSIVASAAPPARLAADNIYAGEFLDV